MQYVIVGNSAAGIAAAEAIRARDTRGEIMIVGAENCGAYVRPRIPQLLEQTGVEDIGFKDAAFYEAKRIILRLGARAVRVQAREKQLVLSDGQSVPYDALLLSYGAQPVMPPLPGIRLRNIYAFTTLGDAQSVKEIAGTAPETVIVGAGLIGLEVAQGLSSHGCTVTLLERAGSMMSMLLPPGAGERLKAHCVARGIKVVTGAQVTGFSGEDAVDAVRLKDMADIPCELCIVCIGTRPDLTLAREAGLAVDRGICVDDRMRTSNPHIFAAGDCAQVEGIPAGVGLWANAAMQGKAAGANMAGGDTRYSGNMTANNRMLLGIQVSTAGQSAPGAGMRLCERETAEEARCLTLSGDTVMGYARVGIPGNVQPLNKLLGKTLSGAQVEQVLNTPLGELKTAVQGIG